MRASPFYDERVLIRNKRVDITAMLDAFWLAGYDGEAYPEQPKNEVTVEEALDALISNALDSTRNPLPPVESVSPDA